MPNQPTVLGRLARLEDRYRIDREPLEAELEQAKATQAEVDAFVAQHGQDATGWGKLAKNCRYRRDQALKASERLSQEALTGRLDGAAVVHLVARLHYLVRELVWGLDAQARMAGELARLARRCSGRTRGRPSAKLVDECLKRLVDRLASHEPPISNRDRLDYVATLAQVVGLMKETLRNPREALSARLRRHRPGLDLQGLEALGREIREGDHGPVPQVLRLEVAEGQWLRWPMPVDLSEIEEQVRAQLRAPEPKLETFPPGFPENAKLSVPKQSEPTRRKPRTAKKQIRRHPTKIR